MPFSASQAVLRSAGLLAASWAFLKREEDNEHSFVFSLVHCHLRHIFGLQDILDIRNKAESV